MSNVDFEIARLKEELKRETLRRDALEQTVHESEVGLRELQNKLGEEYNDNSNNMWKQKYEKQYEKNTYLEHELKLMKEKLEALSKTIDESPTSKKADQPDLDLRLLLRQLEHEKCVLEGKVKDSEWRLDSESKELFKLSEKKREYMLNLNQSFQSAAILNKKKSDWMKNRYQGIPDNQRIIDPRKGPIKKNACRVNLPKITTTEVDAVVSANKKRKHIKKTSTNKEKVHINTEVVTSTVKHLDDKKNNEKTYVINNNENTDGVSTELGATTNKNVSKDQGELNEQLPSDDTIKTNEYSEPLALL